MSILQRNIGTGVQDIIFPNKPELINDTDPHTGDWWKITIIDPSTTFPDNETGVLCLGAISGITTESLGFNLSCWNGFCYSGQEIENQFRKITLTAGSVWAWPQRSID